MRKLVDVLSFQMQKHNNSEVIGLETDVIYSKKLNPTTLFNTLYLDFT